MPNPADIQKAAARIAEAFDGIDILINNAGTGTAETIMEAPDDKWQYFWDLHVMAAVRLSRALVPLMRKSGGGGILNTDWRKTAGLMTKGTSTTVDQYLDKIAKDNAPIGRFATPEELAHFYVFLCSPRAGYCLGSSSYVAGR